MDGHLNWIGDVGECVNTRSFPTKMWNIEFEAFSGKYCSARFNLLNKTMEGLPNLLKASYGLCVPNTCYFNDIDYDKFNQDLLIYTELIPKLHKLFENIQLSNVECLGDTSTALSAGAIVVIWPSYLKVVLLSATWGHACSSQFCRGAAFLLRQQLASSTPYSFVLISSRALPPIYPKKKLYKKESWGALLILTGLRVICYKSSPRSKRNQNITTDDHKPPISSLTTDAYIYGLPKIHKPNIPLHPIAAHHRSPAALLAKHPSNLLSPLPKQYKHQSSVHNTQDFIEDLWKISPDPNNAMCSHDVAPLLPNPPQQLIKDSASTLLSDAQTDPSIAQTTGNLIDIRLKMNIFSFTHTHTQVSDLQADMGFPNGKLVFNHCSRINNDQNIDNSINDKHETNIGFWCRYVDDIFCICDKNSIDQILTSLNNYHSDMSFTIEDGRWTLLKMPYHNRGHLKGLLDLKLVEQALWMIYTLADLYR
ncbi:hypothetical protein LAZ67_18002086 [Cordylochernes scorpioides]|uniref:Reverse transcriptase domain-containing protein n=1 Tax=Cordylochernes scorpioides TaxID=51811 RepID=A0ABY6LIH8_9ARAC|nr:hypothetical protein LAZ67_18002086 [Cordylochernes scorpioides]